MKNILKRLTRKELEVSHKELQERSSNKQYVIRILMDLLDNDKKIEARKAIDNYFESL
jgi:transcription initiation factor IIE alpha subunit|tara:strand:- start:856 stop:1029 length:174 start_codon:yes stop_codon:yes gene_type:complete